MRINFKNWFPSNFDVEYNKENLGVYLIYDDVKLLQIREDSLYFVDEVRKLGRKIFLALIKNKDTISILNLPKTQYDMCNYSNEIYSHLSLYKNNLIEFIQKNGLPYMSSEEYDSYFDVDSSIKELTKKILNPLIKISLTLFFLETIRINKDKYCIKKIYNICNVKDKESLIHILNDLLIYISYKKGENIIIKQISTNRFSYEREIFSFLDFACEEYYRYIYSNFSEIRCCIKCGEYIKKNDIVAYCDIHRHCLDDFIKSCNEDFKKRLSKQKDPKKIEKIKKQMKKISTDQDYYDLLKKREADKKYYYKNK